MKALQQCLPVQLDQHRLPVTLDRAAAAQMLPLPASCGLRITLKLYPQCFQVWHCTAVTGPDLFASICRICQKICKNNMQNMNKIMQNMTKNMQNLNMTKKMQNNMKNVTKICSNMLNMQFGIL
jgi:hypothetical protein